MTTRVYVLIDAADGKAHKLVRALRGRPGIMFVDIVEGPPDVVMVAEAEDRPTVARLTVQALASVEGLTDNVQFLTVSNTGMNLRRPRRGHEEIG